MNVLFLNYVKASGYNNSPSIQNDTTSENLSITTYEAHVSSIDNKW